MYSDNTLSDCDVSQVQVTVNPGDRQVVVEVDDSLHAVMLLALGVDSCPRLPWRARRRDSKPGMLYHRTLESRYLD